MGTIHRSNEESVKTTPGKPWMDSHARPMGEGMTLRNKVSPQPCKATWMAAALLTVCGAVAIHVAHAQEIVQCGNRYSDTPSPGCKILAGPSGTPGASTSQASAYRIDGVRLGMTPDQAIAALSRHFGVPAGAIRRKTTPSGLLGASAVVSYIQQAAPAEAIGVKFGIDPATSSLRAQTIIAGEPSSASGRRAMDAATVARYGAPTADVTAGQFDLWCAKPSPFHGRGLPACAPNTQQLFLFDGGFGPPFATLTQGGLFMSTWDTLALVVAPG